MRVLGIIGILLLLVLIYIDIWGLVKFTELAVRVLSESY